MVIPVLWMCLAAAIFLLIAWTNRVAAFGLLIALLPTYLLRFELFGVPGTMLEMMILVLAVAVVVQERRALWSGVKKQFQLAVQSPAKWLQTPSGIATIAIGWLLIASVIALFVSVDLRSGLGIWKAYIVEPIVLACMLPFIIRGYQDVRVLLKAVMVTIVLVGALGMFQWATGLGIPDPWQDVEMRRVVSVFPYPNAVGLYLAPLTALLIGVCVHGKTLFESRVQLQRWRVGMSAVVLLGLLSMVAAKADGAIVAVAAATVTTLFFTRLRWFTVVFSGLFLALALLVEKTRSILLFQDVSGDVRLALWNGTWNLLSHRLLQGSGLASFPQVYNEYRLPSHVELLEYSHNLLFDFWTQLGLLGALWIVAVVIAGLVITIRGRKATQNLSLPILGVLVAFVVYGLVDVPYFKNDLSVLSWLLFAGILWVYSKIQHQKKPQKS